MNHFPSDDRLALTVESLGQNSVLSSEDWDGIERVISKKDPSLVTLDYIETDQIMRALNDILDSYLHMCFEPSPSRAERQQLLVMADLLTKYSGLAKKFKHTSFMPPYLPRKWYDDAMSTFRQIEIKIDSGAKGGRPENIADVRFVACCAALFSVVFERQPTKTPESAKPSTGTFACFLEAIEETCWTCHALVPPPVLV